MHNVVYLIGRLTEDPAIKEYEDGLEKLTCNLAVQREFKNEDGIYEVDYIRCILWNALANHTCEYCKKGDLKCQRLKIYVDTRIICTYDLYRHYAKIMKSPVRKKLVW